MMVHVCRFLLLVLVSSWCSITTCTPARSDQYNSILDDSFLLDVEQDENLEYGGEAVRSDDDDDTSLILDGEEAVSRSCGSCGLPQLTNAFNSDFSNFPLDFSALSLLGDRTLVALAVPILVLQIITLSIVVYILKSHKDYDSTGTGTSSYYSAYPVRGGGGDYSDTYSSYRSLVPSDNTMTWALGKLTDAMDLYQEYHEQRNSI